MNKKDKNITDREMFEYKVTGRLPRKFRRETTEKWYLSDDEVRRLLKLPQKDE